MEIEEVIEELIGVSEAIPDSILLVDNNRVGDITTQDRVSLIITLIIIIITEDRETMDVIIPTQHLLQLEDKVARCTPWQENSNGQVRFQCRIRGSRK